MALIQQTGAIDVYFEETIRILMPNAKPLREDVVRSILDEAQVEFSRIQKSAGS